MYKRQKDSPFSIDFSGANIAHKFGAVTLNGGVEIGMNTGGV